MPTWGKWLLAGGGALILAVLVLGSYFNRESEIDGLRTLGGQPIGEFEASRVTPEPPRSVGGMEASAVIQRGGGTFTNLNDFSWYGPIYTIDGEYTSRDGMDDPNYPMWRSDKEIPPGGTDGLSWDTLSDAAGQRWRLPMKRPVVDLIVIEAKTDPDGPYNLRGVMHVESP